MVIPTYNKVHSKFKLNGVHYSYDDLKEVAYSFIKEGEPFEKVIGDFLTDWLSASEYITAYTSGTTDTPKEIQLSKQHMVNSAINTADFFDLEPGNSALHCLPGNYIAGKMMLVRAIAFGLEIDLTEPTASPIFDYDKTYDFSAMVPLQLSHMVDYIGNIKNILVGSAVVSNKLKARIQKCPGNIFETYGMTETCTHIAARRLNNFDRSPLPEDQWHLFTALPNVNISQDLRGCLVIDAPYISTREIITNDIIKIHSDRTFDWLGRMDNMINSGGVKLYPEVIENKLSKHLMQRFFVASKADELLGQKLILVVEGKSNSVDKSVFTDLDKYEIPKEIYYLPKFIETFSGKIQRTETLQLLK